MSNQRLYATAPEGSLEWSTTCDSDAILHAEEKNNDNRSWKLVKRKPVVRDLFEMVQTSDFENENSGNPQVRLCEIVRASGSCGFNLTKSKWDPYPWVSNVECGSPAEGAGVQAGDCLLEVNGEDVLGLRVAEVAHKVKARDEKVTVMLWSSGADPKCTPETLCCGPMPTNLQRLSSCMNNILASLECPVCLDTIHPPTHQCANGHLICIKCRVKTDKCPVCRLKLFRGRSLLADQVYNSLIDAFDLRSKEESKQRKMLKQKMQGHKYGSLKSKPEIKINLLTVPTNKILSRLLKSGKSSSAENLAESNTVERNSNFLNTLDNFHSGLRAKSLSSNEIFSLDNQPASRMLSVLSYRPGSGLLDVQPVIFSKRPASYHGSVEDLQKGTISEFGSQESLNTKNFKCHCPCDNKCKQRVNSNSLIEHIEKCHGGPILHFFKPDFHLFLPLPYETVTVLVTAYGKSFIVKILDNCCKRKDNYLWVWSLNSKQDFKVSLTTEENELKVTTECPILSFETTGWQDLDENYGIPLKVTKGSVKLEIKYA